MHCRTLLASLLLAVSHLAMAAPTVVDFGPSGLAREVRQVRLRFSDEMVALGDNAAPDAATVSCDQGKRKAVGHWIDGRNWVGEFEEALPDGVACAVVPAALTSANGKRLAAAAKWSFNTGGPRAELIDPRKDNTREEAIAIFKPSVAVDAGSLRFLSCRVGNVGTPVTILGGRARQEALSGWRVETLYGQDKAHWIVAQCGAKPWPNGAHISWTWGKRISANGLSSPVDVPFRQRVRDPLGYDVKCAQLSARAGCDPRGPLTVVFSEPVSSDIGGTILLRGSAGKQYAVKSLCYNTRTCTRFDSSEPFQEGETVTPEFAQPVRDTDGRLMTGASAPRHAILIARLAPYVGMVQGDLTLPWTPEGQARVAVATRNAEPDVAVRSWRFGGAAQDIPALLALHRMAASRFDKVLGGALPAEPYAASGAVLARVGGAPPATREQTVHPDSSVMAFTALPMAGYGSWLVEADSARYRAALAEQTQSAEPARRRGADGARLSLVQLTNLQVSARLSPDHPSLLWVTSIDSGKPVAGADVTLWSCAGELLAQTTSGADGRALFARLPAAPHCGAQADARSGEFWIVLRKDDDICVLRSGAFGQRQSSLNGHTILDRVLFKAGETVSMQTLARLPVATGYALPQPFQGKLKIYFQYSELVDEKDVAFDRSGSATSAWKIPPAAKLGAYRFTVADTAGNLVSEGNFQVEEYRMPAFDASLKGSTVWHGERQDLTLSAGLRFLAGGVAAGQQVTLRGSYRENSSAAGYDYTFRDRELERLPALQFVQRALTLAADGTAAVSLPAPQVPQSVALHAEIEFTDPNGEIQVKEMDMPIWPRRHKVGLQGRTGFGPGLVRFSVIVLDENDKPLPGQSVTVDGAPARRDKDWNLMPIDEGSRFPLCALTTDVHGKGECTVQWTRANATRWLVRARAAGASSASFDDDKGFFMGWNHTTLTREGAAPPRAGEPLSLTLRSPLVPATALVTVEREGVLASYVHAVERAEQVIVVPTTPQFAPGVRVNVQIAGNAAEALNAPSAGKANTASSAIDVLFDPASHRLQVDLSSPGPTAPPGQAVPLRVKARQGALPAAGAHVTLLAYDDGLTALRANLTTLVQEKFWRMRYVPIFSPQLHLTWPHSVQLGKMPAWWPPGEREATHVDWYPPSPDGEVTVVVTGQRAQLQSALKLKQASEDARITTDRLEVLQRVVGTTMDRNRQGAPDTLADQDGPQSVPRSDFSSLALWKTDIVLDEKGEALVPVPLGDALTRWRIVAVAIDGADRYGTGTAFIRTRKDIQILSGLPPSVRSDDSLRQKLTLRNDGERAVTLQLRADARLVADPSLPQGAPLTEQARAERGLKMRRSVTLEAHQNMVVDWTLAVPDRVTALDWTISAANPKARDGKGSDSLKVMQKVVPAAPVTVRESTIVQLDAPRSISVAQPPGARPFTGGVAVSWRASLADAAAGAAQAWMAAYPFRCMEQVTSMAVAGADPAQWQQAMAQLPKFIDPDGLASYFPGTPGSEVLTAYLLDISAAAQLPLPAPEKAKMQAALRQGLIRSQARDWLPAHAALAHRLALQAALAGELGGAPQVVPPDLNALPTIALLDWVRHLMTGAHTPARSKQLDAAAGMLRTRFDLQGTRLTWRGDSANQAWWMMWTDHVATARTALLLQQWAALDARWKDDVPRLALALVDQQRQGHWDTTVANAWALTALRRFARDGERGPVTGVSHAAFGDASAAQHWPRDEPALLAWPAQGARGTLELRHEGSGAPWASVRISAAMHSDKAVSHGISVKRTVSAVQQKVAGRWSEGDVMKVTLELTSGADFNWLAVTDPIPSGATILGKGLGGESLLAQQAATGAGRTSWWDHPSYEERGDDSYRAYYQRVAAHTWTTSYVLRLNNAGSFVYPPTRVEAMYAPEIFGEAPNLPLEVSN
jgi:uncharacterized protein YfaS (alpha-2-macroglobulin family)